MPRPGFVLEVDRSTPPLLFWRGEGFSLERLPAGRTRVDLRARAARRASRTSTAPSGAPCSTPSTADPLPALLFPGMKLTIAFDDVSLPLPKMRRPDVRQRVIEAVLDLAADAGVDDVHLIAALALHRRMTEAELRHAVGDRVYDAFAPERPALQPRRRGPRQPGRTSARRRTAKRSRSTSGRPRATCSSTSTSTSSPWTAAGSRRPPAWPRTAASATTTTSARCSSRARSWTSTAASCTTSNWRMGKVITDAGVKVFQIETTLNTDIFPESVRRSWPSGSGSGRPATAATYLATTKALKRTPERMRREDLPVDGVTAPDDGRARRGGRGGAPVDDANVSPAAARAGRGPDRHPDDGHPVHLPVQRRLDHEPDPRDVHRARLLLQLLPRQAAGARGRRGHHDPPDATGTSTPSTTRATSTSSSRCWPTRPTRSRSRPATRSSSPRTSGTATCTGRATPTTASTRSTCGTGARTACSTCGRVIIVGGDPQAVRRLGFTPASTMDDALEMATDVVGPPPDHHPPAHPAADAGGRALGRRSDGSPLARAARAAPGPPHRATGPCAASGGRRSSSAASTRRSASRTAGRPSRAASWCRRRSRRSAPTTTPSGPGGGRPASPARSSPTDRCGWPCRCWRRPRSGASIVWPTSGRSTRRRRATRRRPSSSPPNHHSHLDTPLAITAIPEPWRGHLVVGAAADYFFTSHADRARRRRWCSTRSRSTRNVAGRQSADLARELIDDGWSLRHLPRGRPLARRLGAAVQGRRRLPLDPDRRARRARVHRGRRLHPGQGHEAAQARQDHRHVRLAAVARAGREHPPLQRPHRAGRHRPRRRDPDRLVVGPPTGRPPGQPRR